MDESTRIYCPSSSCSAKVEQKIIKWVEHIGILGLGKEMVARFVEQGIVNVISDLYNPRFKETALSLTNLKKATEKALNELYSVRELPLEKFIAGFNIRSFGERHTKKLIEAGYDTLTALQNITEEEFINVKGLGSSLYSTFSENMTTLKSEMDDLANNHIFITPPVKKGSSLEGKVFVITGKLTSGSRKEIETLIESKGGTVGSSVNSKTTFLVNNDTLSMSSKNKKAKELSVEIISEYQLLDLLK